MANNEDIQNGFLTEIEPLLRNSDYYIAQKGFVKIPKYDEEAEEKKDAKAGSSNDATQAFITLTAISKRNKNETKLK